VFVLITHLAENGMEAPLVSSDASFGTFYSHLEHSPATALDLEGVFRISVSFLDLQEMKEMLETGTTAPAQDGKDVVDC
jgi:hypothetical protein